MLLTLFSVVREGKEQQLGIRQPCIEAWESCVCVYGKKIVTNCEEAENYIAHRSINTALQDSKI